VSGSRSLSANEAAVVDRWRAEREVVWNARTVRARAAVANAAPGRLSDRSTTPATDSRGQQLTGTDLQYDRYMGPAPPSALAGTDQQYFGVQFGPSETLAEKPAKGPRKLLFVRAFDETLVQIVRYEWNIRSPRFGLPVMYRITLNDPREQHTGIGLPLATVFVHWSRVIHLARVAENAGASEIFAAPIMRPVLNNLLGLHKLYAGSPEMFWKGAFPGMKATTPAELGGDVDVDVNSVRDTLENYFNGLQRYLLGTGLDFEMLSPTVSDPTPHLECQLKAVAIKLSMPMRVFMGSERGELASSQDDADWNGRVAAHQQGYETPRVIVPFIDRLIQAGVLREPKRGSGTKAQPIRNAAGQTVGVRTPGGYSVEWPGLDSKTDKDRAAIALQVTQALAAYVGGQVESVVPPFDYLTRVLGLDDEEATAILDAATEAHDAGETMSMPPQVAGRPAAPEKGSAEFEKQQKQQEQSKAQLAALKQQKGPPGAAPSQPPAGAGKPPAPGAGTPPPQPPAAPGKE
jgi:hypothetical protein